MLVEALVVMGLSPRFVLGAPLRLVLEKFSGHGLVLLRRLLDLSVKRHDNTLPDTEERFIFKSL